MFSIEVKLFVCSNDNDKGRVHLIHIGKSLDSSIKGGRGLQSPDLK